MAFVAGKQIIFVHSGLLLSAKSAEEIIGVLAHEMGHLKAGHVPRRDAAIADANSANALAALAAIAVAAGGGGDAAAGVLIGGQDQVTRKFLQNIRHDEAVADEIGLTLLDKSGISAVGLRDLMLRMATQRALPENRQSPYYRTHPDVAERLGTYQDHVNGQAGHTTPINDEILALVDRLKIKMRAYVEPPQSILTEFDNSVVLNHLYAKSIAHYRRGTLEHAIKLIQDLIDKTPTDAFFMNFMVISCCQWQNQTSLHWPTKKLFLYAS